MSDRNLFAIHNRIDESDFEVHLLKEAVRSLQQRVILLEAEVRELRREALERDDSAELRGDNAAEVPPLRRANTRS